ncbi:methyltransferase family protein [Photobacterium ganghwense]|uniref:methyltransferase family protein n=1 Tax=Photobacterium ganghwense TaxID=320778 RepID=UPI001A8EB1EB|nr:isoprenylcysteine carboxylmethyltransferase family protein [Photobacterium ganghwense]MBV1842250.1 isoprenylcysteine carboxylmethyltransferase family protein [Photobacterium ganghwense]QSV12780.1 isoprenylcysteine carboxylmethyltransferase family protein [Photobacterium ganghwense]
MKSLELRIPPLVLLLVFGIAVGAAAAYVPPVSGLMVSGKWLAVILMLSGIGVAWGGVVSFKRAQTTVNPMTPDASSALVTSGVYRVTRNPMYLGFLLMLLAWSCWLASGAGIMLSVGFAWYLTQFQIKPEERMLEKVFPDSYPQYLQQVRRWL